MAMIIITQVAIDVVISFCIGFINLCSIHMLVGSLNYAEGVVVNQQNRIRHLTLTDLIGVPWRLITDTLRISCPLLACPAYGFILFPRLNAHGSDNLV